MYLFKYNIKNSVKLCRTKAVNKMILNKRNISTATKGQRSMYLFVSLIIKI